MRQKRQGDQLCCRDRGWQTAAVQLNGNPTDDVRHTGPKRINCESFICVPHLLVLSTCKSACKFYETNCTKEELNGAVTSLVDI